MSLRPQLRSFIVLHTALMVSVGIYGVILLVMSKQAGFEPIDPPPMNPMVMLGILGAMGLAQIAVVIPMLQHKLMPPRERDGSTKIDFEDPDVAKELSPLLPRLRTGMIMTWALCESIALFGLVGAFVFKQTLYFVPFAVVSTAGFLIHSPSDALFASFVRGARRAR